MRISSRVGPQNFLETSDIYDKTYLRKKIKLVFRRRDDEQVKFSIPTNAKRSHDKKATYLPNYIRNRQVLRKRRSRDDILTLKQRYNNQNLNAQKEQSAMYVSSLLKCIFPWWFSICSRSVCHFPLGQHNVQRFLSIKYSILGHLLQNTSNLRPR